jgi:hypothetical protein
MVLDSDLNPGLAAELPAIVHAARLGNTLPLLRVYQLDSQTSAESAPSLSSALYAATDCHDGPFPWQPDTPIPDRQALVQQAIAALPAGSLGSFGPWSAEFGNASFCLNWPSPSGGVVYGPGPYPDVPMLAVSGGYDMRTPTAGAASVATQFPQGHVLVVPGVGHSVLGADVRLLQRAGAAGCSEVPCQLPARAPRRSSRHARLSGCASAPPPVANPRDAKATIKDAESVWLMTAARRRVGCGSGCRGGRLIESGRSFIFVNYKSSAQRRSQRHDPAGGLVRRCGSGNVVRRPVRLDRAARHLGRDPADARRRRRTERPLFHSR